MTPTYQQPPAERCVASMKKTGKLTVGIVGVLAGVLLLLIGNRVTGKGKEPTVGENSPSSVSARTVETYRTELESRMEEICARVSGVGEVEVVVSFDGGFEYVYAADKKITSAGESTAYITVGNGDSETLVYITERPPAITGIGVVCAGGMDPAVRREVTALLSAAFGVGSNKIYVTGHK